MRPSYFVLYSAVATQAATALLLACALFVLGRYYPRYFLRLWAGAWLTEALHVSLGIASLMLRTPGTDAVGVAPNIATWASQTAGYSHVALLLMGAQALYRGQTRSNNAWVTAVGAAALLALIPTFGVPQDTGTVAVTTRLLVRVGIMSMATGAAAIAAAMLIRQGKSGKPSLGSRWMWAILLTIGLDRFVELLVATSRIGGTDARGTEMLMALPLIEILLMAALGIGTAIALAEDEQEVIRQSAERQVDAERRARQSGASLVSALAAVPDLVTVIGLDAQLVAWNPAFEEFVRAYGGHEPKAGMRVLDVLPGRTTDDWSLRIAGLLQGKDQVFEASFERGDSSPEFFDVSARPMRDASEIVGGVIVARDVTERRKLEQQLHLFFISFLMPLVNLVTCCNEAGPAAPLIQA